MHDSLAAVAIGTGQEQTYFINLAKDLGFSVIGFDQNEDAEGSKVCDYFFPICTSQVHKIIRVLEKFRPSAVIPSPIGKCLKTVGCINDYFGIKSFGCSATEILINKFLFFNLLKKLSINHPKTLYCNDIEELYLRTKELSCPLVIKPVDGSGSRGVLFVKEKTFLGEIYEFLSKNTHLYTSGIVLQEYIEGTHIGIDGLYLSGKLVHINIRKKELTHAPHLVEYCYLSPYSVSRGNMLYLKKSIRKILSHLKVISCVFHADVIINQNAVYIVEMSLRPSGMNISSLLLPEYLNINYSSLFLKSLVDYQNNQPLDIDLTYGKQVSFVLEYIYHDSLLNQQISVDLFESLLQLKFIQKINFPIKLTEIAQPFSASEVLNNPFIIYSVNSDLSNFSINRKKVYDVLLNYKTSSNTS